MSQSIFSSGSFEFDIPKDKECIIKVIGVGGGGGNAVAHMYNQGIVGVDFAICNTDNQSMDASPVKTKIQLGPNLTEGRGAGAKPSVGKQACIESIEEVKQFLANDTKMLFITAGMGGGTGTGAAPIIANAGREMGILTVGIVTVPFSFEGRKREKYAEEGLHEMKKSVDALIIVSNDKLREIHGNLVLSDAFSKADDVLTIAAKGIAEIITVSGSVNVDFEDVNTVMRDSGVAIMGTAAAEGEGRAHRAVTEALNSPLLEDNDIRGARHILLNITSGAREVTMDEIFEITNYVQDEAGQGTDLIWGNCRDENLKEELLVTVIATGFEGKRFAEPNVAPKEQVERVSLFDDTDDEPSRMKPPVAVATDDFDFGVDDVVSLNSVTSEESEYDYHTRSDRKTQEDMADRYQEMQRRKEARAKRVSQLASLTGERIQSMERVPAYQRRAIQLDEVASDDHRTTRLSISDGEHGVISSKNPYLDKIQD